MMLVQSLGFFATFAYLMSFQFKQNKNLFRMQFVASIFYASHFFLLKAYTGALSSLITLIRAYFLASDNKILHTKYACVFICVLQVLICIITFDNISSLFPMIANISVTIAGFINDPKKIRFVGMFINSPLWIVYDVIVGSWAGVVDELVTEASIIISIIRYRFKDEKDIIK